jgi:hypothetical protein
MVDVWVSTLQTTFEISKAVRAAGLSATAALTSFFGSAGTFDPSKRSGDSNWAKI